MTADPGPALRVTATVHRYSTASRPGSLFPYAAGDVARIRFAEVAHCCDEMREAWDDRAVIFGQRDGDDRDANVNVSSFHAYPEGTFSTEYPIRWCPFCAAPVVVTLTEGTPHA